MSGEYAKTPMPRASQNGMISYSAARKIRL